MITILEMTSPTQLVPGKSAPLVLEEVHADSASLIRALYNRIWGPLGPSGRSTWSDEEWTDELTQTGVHTWLALVEGTIAGFTELSAEPTGEVGIVVFGLVPEFWSKGFGAAFLTLTTETAWRLNTPTTRVWLQTSSRDHPNALPNYQRRGFRIFATH